MADCEYQIAGSDKVYSESEFKKLLNDGLLDKLMVENNVKVRGIKPDEAIASSFAIPSAIQPTSATEVKTEAPIIPITKGEETITPQAEVTETVTPETVTKTEEPTAETKTEQINERKKVFSEELDNSDINSIRTSLRKKDPNGYTLQVLDELQEAKKNPNLSVSDDVSELLDNGVTLSNVKNMLIEDGLFETSQEVDNYFNQIGGQKSSGIFKRLSGLKSETKTETPTTPETETKQPTKEAQVAKGLADTLRKAKMNLPKGMAMSNFAPGFDKVWDATIETVAKAIEVGGVTAGNFRQSVEDGLKALRKTDTYKAITDPKERAKITAQYRKALVDLVPQHYNFNTDDLRNAEFETFNQRLEESKGKDLSAKEFNAIKSEAKKFVNNNLPSDSFKKSEVQSYVRNNFDKAKTVEDIQENLNKVNNIIATKEAKIETAEAKQEEKDKKKAITRIKQKVNPRGRYMTRKKGTTKISRISVDAQRKIDSMRKDDMFTDEYLNSLTPQEVKDLEAGIDDILNVGKEDRNVELKERRAEKKSSEATILEGLDTPDNTLNGEEDITNELNNNTGSAVVIDGKVLSKADFKKYMDENPDAELSNVPFYKDMKEKMKDMKKEYASDITAAPIRSLRAGAMGAIRNIETYFADLSKGNRKMRDFLNEKLEAMINATHSKIEDSYRKKTDVRNALKDIFGSLSAADKVLSDNSGIVSDAGGKKPVELTNGRVIHHYNQIRDSYNGNKVNPKKVEKNRSRLEKANKVNPDEIIKLVESNPKLKELADRVADFYNKDYKNDFKDTFTKLTGFEFPDDYYYPEPASEMNPSDVMNLENGAQAMSAVAPNLKLRMDNYTGPFQFMDVREMMDNYIDSMVHAKEFIPLVEDIRPLFSALNSPRVLAKLKSTDKYNDLKESVENLLSGKSSFTPEGQGGFMMTAANFTALTSLWFRFKSVPSQFSAFVNYYPSTISEGVGPLDIMASWVPTNDAEMKFFKDFYLDNPYLYERLSGSNVTIDSQAIQASIDSLANKYARGTIDAAQFIGMFPIKFGDFLAAATPIGGEGFAMAHFKKQLAENGGDYEAARKKAMEQWFKQTERTQQPSKDPVAISTLSKNPLFRVVMPFVSAQIAATRKATLAVKNLQDWKNLSKPEKNQAAADLLFYGTVGSIPFIVSSGAIIGFMQSFTKLMDAEDDEERRIAWNQLLLISTDTMISRIQADFQAMSAVGKIVNIVMNDLSGKPWFNDVPFVKKMESAGIALSGLYNADSNWEDLSPEQQKDFVNKFKLDKYDEREFNKLTDDEKTAYLRDRFLHNMTMDEYRKFMKMYSDLPRIFRVGKTGVDAFKETIGYKNLEKIVDGIDALMKENADIQEIIYDIPTEESEEEYGEMSGEKADYSSYFKQMVKNTKNQFIFDIFGQPVDAMLNKVESAPAEGIEYKEGPKKMRSGGRSRGRSGGRSGGRSR